MDPNESLFSAVDSLQTASVFQPNEAGYKDNVADAIEALRSLADWLERGGFVPSNIDDTEDGYVITR